MSGLDVLDDAGPPRREMRMFGAYGAKPVWRGRIHQVAFFLSIPAGLWLLAGASSTQARVAVAIYWTDADTPPGS